jgi:hypothetical protein
MKKKRSGKDSARRKHLLIGEREPDQEEKETAAEEEGEDDWIEEPIPRTFVEGTGDEGNGGAAAAVCSGELVRLRGEGAIILAAAGAGDAGLRGRGREGTRGGIGLVVGS